ncbi:ROK family protein [Acidicapsa ligni]|uniref:ROK family protein n=1 Tax=Acidicapsa ligni TaxID=542300 RepID=UPI0021DFFF74|nr:ROK family protein [Acidicapsa ligni]
MTQLHDVSLTQIDHTNQNSYVVGVDIGGTNLRLALTDMSGTIVARWSTGTVGIREASRVVELICDGVDHLLQQVGASRNSLRAISAGAPGITNVDDGIVIATSYLMGWRDVPFRALLEDALGIPAAVDNDVNLAAIGESWAGAGASTRDFVFLAIGTGVGAGIMLNGRPFRGMSWTAGEIGYMLVPGTPERPADLGQPGALETIIGGEGIKDQWRSLWRADSTALPQELTATQIFDHALQGDALAQTILNQTARLLANTIYNISLVLNCPLFVLGGGVGIHPALRDATQEILHKWGTRVQPQLLLSTLGADAQLMGAIRLALDTAQEHEAKTLR